MGRAKNDTLRLATLDYLTTIDPKNPPAPGEIEHQLLAKVREAFIIECSTLDKTEKWIIPQSLTFSQIADIIAALYDVCRISCAGENSNGESDLLAIYQTDGIDEGIYITEEDTFRKLARQYNYNLTDKEFKEMMITLRGTVTRKVRCIDPDLIAVNNGIFNYKTKTLQPFTPESIFLTKSRINYNVNAVNITLHNDEDDTDWDVDSWMESLSDDKEITDSLWEILGAIIRPHVRWNKSAWLYSEKGNNGKGTLCELMRNLCGPNSYASISIADFGRDFLLEPLTRAAAVIVDENDVGTFIDKAANLKAVITGDVIQINRKFKQPIAYKFHGFMVQCLNEFPRIKDKSDSFYRRQLFIPMTKCFTGKERRYIKSEYLHNKDVLEYVLHRVLHSNYYTLSEPEACKNILKEYKEFNDPVRQFFDELSPLFIWDLLPFHFLYELYKAWFKKNSPSGGVQGKNTFINDLMGIVATDENWYCTNKLAKIRPANRMDKPEPLIMQYNLTDWMNPTYTGPDIQKRCMPSLAANYRGLQRYQSINSSEDDTAPSEGDEKQ